MISLVDRATKSRLAKEHMEVVTERFDTAHSEGVHVLDSSASS